MCAQYLNKSLCVFVCFSSLMQRRYSEPNTYIDTQPSLTLNSDELYDDVASIADPEVCLSSKNRDGNQTDYQNVVYFLFSVIRLSNIILLIYLLDPIMWTGVRKGAFFYFSQSLRPVSSGLSTICVFFIKFNFGFTITYTHTICTHCPIT